MLYILYIRSASFKFQNVSPFLKTYNIARKKEKTWDWNAKEKS